jgi:fibronectin-binding autotransporter adhesin
MRKARQFTILSMAVASALIAPIATQAQTTYSWRSEATNGNWNVAANWWDGTSTNLPNAWSILNFDNNVQTTMINDLSSPQIYRILFTANSSSARNITGGTITFGNSSYGSLAVPQIVNSSSVNHVIGSALTFNSNSSSRFELISNSTTSTAGGLTFGGTVTLNTALDLFSNATGASPTAAVYTFNSAIAAGANAFTLKDTSSQETVVVLTAANTANAGNAINIYKGRVELGSATAAWAGGYNVGLAGNTGNAELRLTPTGGGITIASGSNITVNTIGASGTRTINSANTSGTNAVNSTVTVNGPLTLSVNTGGTLAFASGSGTGFAGTGAMNKSGSGTATITSTGTLSYTGATTVSSGILQWNINNTANLTSNFGASTLTLNGGTFQVNPVSATNGTTFTLSNNVAVGSSGGSLLVASGQNSGSGRTINFTGSTTLSSGALTIGSAGGGGNQTSINFNNALTLDQTAAGTRSLVFSTGGNTTWNFGGSIVDGAGGFSNPLTLSAVSPASGPRDLFFLGTGHTYAGGTVVNSTSAFVMNVGSSSVATPLGTGNVTLNQGGLLRLNNAANLASTRTVTVNNPLATGTNAVTGIGIGFDANPATYVNTASTGTFVLGIDSANTTTNINLGSIASGATVVLGTISGNVATTGTFSGTVTPAGTHYRLGGGGGNLILTGANALTGTNTAQIGGFFAVDSGRSGGTITLANTNNISGAITVAGGTQFAANTLALRVSGAAGTSPITLTSSNNNGPTLRFETNAQTQANNLTLSGSNNVNLTANIAATLSGTVNQGTANVTYNGSSVLIRSAATTGTGTTTISSGSLGVSNMNQLSSGNLTLSGGILVLDGVSWASFTADRSSAIGIGANQWQLTGATGGFAARTTPVTINTTGTTTSTFDRDFAIGSSALDANGSLYANAGVTISQSIALTANRTILVNANGVGLGTGTNVLNAVSGNISGAGGLVVRGGGNAISTPGVLVLSGAQSYTGAPSVTDNGQVFNAGAGGLLTQNGAIVQFDSDAALPTGGTTTPTYLGAMQRNGTGTFGFLFSGASGAGKVYDLPSNYRLAIGGVGGSANAGVLGADGGLATLQGSRVLVHASNATLATTSDTNSLNLLVRSGSEFVLGTTGAGNDVRFIPSNGADTSTSTTATAVVDSTGARTLIKRGDGTLTLSNVSYTRLDGTTSASSAFSWQIGRATTGNSGSNAYFDGAVRETGAASSNSLTGFTIQLRGGVLETSNTVLGGSFTRGTGTGSSQVNWGAGGGGFAAFGGPLTVNIGGSGATQTWNAGNFVPTSDSLILGSNTADDVVTWQNPVDLNGAVREIRVLDNTNATNDSAIMSGVLSGATSSGINKTGAGTLELSSPNSSYTGSTTVSAGVLVVRKLSNGSSNSSIGSSTNAASNLVFGAGATLRYTGTGDSTDRQMTYSPNANNTGFTLDASGSGALKFTSTAAIVSSVNNQGRFYAITGTSTADNTLAAQFTDNGSGATALTKSGSGKWIVTNAASSYTGGTFINAGTLSTSSIKDGGTASPLGAGTLIALGREADTGTLLYTGSGDTSNRNIRIGVLTGAGGAAIINDGSGPLIFTSTSFNVQTSSSNTRALTLGGSYTGGVNEIQGGIQNNTGTFTVVRLDKTGAGTWSLSGASTYTGTTTVSAGTLRINNTTGSGTGSGAVTVNNTATLAGGGSISGSTSVLAGGTLAPGNSLGVLTVGSLTLADNAIYSVELTGTGNVAGTDYDQTIVTGGTNVVLGAGAGTNLVLSQSGYTHSPGNLFTIINNTSATASNVTGSFNNAGGAVLANNAQFLSSSNAFRIQYNVGSNTNDVTLTALNKGALAFSNSVAARAMVGESASGATLTLANTTGAFSAANTTTVGYTLSGGATGTGSLAGGANITLTSGSLVATNLGANNTAVNAAADLFGTSGSGNFVVNGLQQRVVTGSTIALGRQISGADLSGNNYTGVLSSTTGDNATRTNITVDGAAFNGSVASVNRTFAGPASVAASGTFATYTQAGGGIVPEGLTGEGTYANISIGYTATPLAKRVVTATGVSLGRVMTGTDLSGNNYTAALSTTGDDNSFTRVTVAGNLFDADNESVTGDRVGGELT